MSSSQDSERARARLAVVLALIAGYVDCYGFLTYRVYASFMSGNTTQTGLQAGEANLALARHNLLPIPAFVVGIFVGTFVVHSSLRHQLRWLLGIVAALLAVGMAAVYLGPPPDWLSIIILSLAMGLMNVTVTRVGEQPISLGFVTGTLNNLAQDLALAVKRIPVPHAQGSWDTHGWRIALLASVWTVFLIGTILAGAATPRFAMWTLLLPLVVLLVLAGFTRAVNADA
jgi:uncharacterized membrane protein YoaK (UPF0700 family)